MTEEAVNVFLSYSRKDLEMLTKLNDHLAGLRRTNKIETWHDRDIEAGSEWEPAIQNRLNTADIIILLISANFINSDYCYGNELKRAIERHDGGEARVIPVILKPCFWNLREIPFSKLNVLPDHALAITEWQNQERAFANVAEHISKLVESLRNRKLEQQAEETRRVLAQKEAAEKAERERIQLARQQAEEQEIQRHAELLRQKQAAEAERVKQAVEKKRQQEQAKPPLPDALKGNYAQLESLLKADKWKEADQETTKRMCEVMGRQKEGWLRAEDIEQFPCADLREIDRLWVKYSNGKFGFSVQKKIWQECDSPTEYNSNWEKFGDRVGWRTKGLLGLNKEWKLYTELTFDDTSAPKGHLPSDLRYVGGFFVVWVLGVGGCGWLVALFSRAQTCKL